jgi:hypothetical protein
MPLLKVQVTCFVKNSVTFFRELSLRIASVNNRKGKKTERTLHCACLIFILLKTRHAKDKLIFIQISVFVK